MKTLLFQLVCLFVGFITPFCESGVTPLMVTVDEGEQKGYVVADSFHIFNIPIEERVGKYFKIVSEEQLQLSHKSIKLNESLLRVDSTTGIVSLDRTIDRDSLCGRSRQCVLVARVMMLPHEVFRLLELNMNISDVNDNTPTFPTNCIVVNISEEIQVGEVINLNQFQAKDIDLGRNSLLTYTMTPNFYFDVESFFDEAGRHHLQLRVIEQVDFERKTIHNYQLTATDHGSPPRSAQSTLSIMISDSNDNPPVFERQNYVVFVSENVLPGTKIARVKAIDLDWGRNGQIIYSLIKTTSTPSNKLELISVDRESGDVTLQKPDRLTDGGLQFEIEASDLGIPPLSSKVWLTLRIEDVNDHDPIIKLNPIVPMIDGKGFISEYSLEGKYIAYIIVSDDDQGINGQVDLKVRTFARTNNGGNEVIDQFAISKDGLMHVTAKPFDREVINQYYITISACDKGKPQRCSGFNFSIEILDENDHEPEFSQSVYDVTMSESDKAGSEVIRLVALDKDKLNGPAKMMNEKNEIVPSTYGDITYSIVDGEETFSIDPYSGRMVLTRPLDREQEFSWEVTIKATDQGRPQHEVTCLLKVFVMDVNDNLPLFIFPPKDNVTVYASINLEEAVSKIEVVDYDSDVNSDVTIKIIEIDGVSENSLNTKRNLFHYFVLDTFSGQLYINKSASNLKDIIGKHYVTIEAVDNGNPPLANKVGMYIDVTELLVLPSPFLPEPKHLPGGKVLSFNILLIIVIASVVFVFLVILLASFVFIRRRKQRDMERTYNCQDAEHQNGCRRKSSPVQSSKEDHIPEELPPLMSFKEKFRSLSPVDCKPKTVSVSSTYSSIGIVRPNTAALLAHDEATTYQISSPRHSTGKFTRGQPPSTSVPINSDHTDENLTDGAGALPATSSQLDMDSGRGDSEADSSCVQGIPDRKIGSFIDGTDRMGSTPEARCGMVGRCSVNCALYGHSDSCWMPNEGEINGLHHIGKNVDDLTAPLRLKRIPQLSYSAVPRENLRTSLCLALETKQHHRYSFRSDPSHPFHPAEDLSRIRRLRNKKDDSPYSSVFGSNSSSPAPQTGCNKMSNCSTIEREALLRKGRYLSRDREVGRPHICSGNSVGSCNV